MKQVEVRKELARARAGLYRFLGGLYIMEVDEETLANMKQMQFPTDCANEELAEAYRGLEKAIADYRGTVLMVSHDFYLVADCADYVLLVEDNTVRRMRARTFRKMVYDKYFDQKYLETDRKKQALETNITQAFRKNDFEAVEKLLSQLEEISGN